MSPVAERPDVRQLKLRPILSSIQIACQPSVVWDLIEDPEKLPHWKPAVISVELLSSGARTTGYCYRVTTKLGTYHVEIARSEPPHHLSVITTIVHESRRLRVETSYSLSPSTAGTLLIQSVEFDNSPLVWAVGYVVHLVSRIFGLPGDPTLRRLKKLAERSWLSGRGHS